MSFAMFVRFLTHRRSRAALCRCILRQNGMICQNVINMVDDMFRSFKASVIFVAMHASIAYHIDIEYI